MNIRPAIPEDAGGIAQVHVTSWNESYRGILPDEVIAKRSVESMRALWSKALSEENRVSFVAEDANGVFAFASSIVLDSPQAGFTAYLQTLYVIARAKRSGAGRALLSATAAALMEKGCKNLALRTLRLNEPARGFYEHLGATLIPEGIAEDQGLYDDVVYGFNDLQTLVVTADPRTRYSSVRAKCKTR